MPDTHRNTQAACACLHPLSYQCLWLIVVSLRFFMKHSLYNYVLLIFRKKVNKQFLQELLIAHFLLVWGLTRVLCSTPFLGQPTSFVGKLKPQIHFKFFFFSPHSKLNIRQVFTSHTSWMKLLQKNFFLLIFYIQTNFVPVGKVCCKYLLSIYLFYLSI